MRTEAKETGDEAKSLTAKLFGNSVYGKMGESVEKYRTTTITTDDLKATKLKKSALHKNHETLIADGEIACHELSNIKAMQEDNKPVHIAVAILQNSKLIFLRYILLVRPDY